VEVTPEEVVRRLAEFSRELGRSLTAPERRVKERYTITGDLISYSICPRQYGYYRHYGFAPSNPTQEWFGSAIHRFLKKVHSIYARENRIVEPSEVEEILSKVENALEAEGRTPSSPKAREKVLRVLEVFVKELAPEFVPRIRESELRLVKELPDFILYGIVDALVGTSDEKYEIWDYKGMNRPYPSTSWGRKKLDAYRKQMFVYGYLFRERNGSYPERAVLFFMNELVRGGDPYLEIDFTSEEVQKEVEDFVEEFAEVVRRIEESRRSGRWELPAKIDLATCRQCDFRWDCPRFLRP